MQGEHLNAGEYLNAGEHLSAGAYLHAGDMRREENVPVGEYLRTGQRENPCNAEQGVRLILHLTRPGL